MSPSEKFLVSIIIATKNSENTLERCIESINKQSFREYIQVLVKDAKSDDSTLLIANKKLHKSDEIIISRDSSIYEAWNQALSYVEGSWVLFLGSDDSLYSPKSIEHSSNYFSLADKLGLKVCYGNVILKKDEHIVEQLGKKWEVLEKNVTNIMNLPHTGLFHHKDLFSIYGDFDKSFKIAGDYEFLLRYFKEERKAIYMNDVIVTVMSDDGISGSMDQRKEMYLETKRARSENGINSFSFPLFLWGIRLNIMSLLKKFLPQNVINNIADSYRFIIGKSKRWTYK